MLSLERTAVLTWLKEKEPDKPDLLDPPVRPAEARQEVEGALLRLGESLTTALERDPDRLASQFLQGPVRDEFRVLLGQLGAPRALRLIHWLMSAGLPSVDLVLAAVLAPDHTGTGQFLQATLAHAARSPLLERIFAPQRMTALLNACPSSNILKEAA